jgi:hypothetical protein
MRVQTAKGEHWFYRHSGQPVRNAVRVTTDAGELEIDIRGDGGYVVGPGSTHHTGHVYKAPEPWPPTLDALPVFSPGWFAAPQKQEQAATDGSIPKGRRDNHLASLAGSMRARGMTPAAIEAALLEENRRRCSPPLEDCDVKRIAASVGRYEPDRRDEPSAPVLKTLSTVRTEAVIALWPRRLFKERSRCSLATPARGKAICPTTSRLAYPRVPNGPMVDTPRWAMS